MTILLALSALMAGALYALAWFSALRRFSARTPRDAGVPAPVGATQTGVLLAAAACHAVALGSGVLAGDGLRYGFGPALSASFLVGVLVLLVEPLSSRVDALRVVVLPATLVMALLPLAFPGTEFPAERARPLFLPHLVFGTLAYGVLLLAALYASLMSVVERSLHRASTPAEGGWLARLPPLLVLERILFRLITFGFLMLTLTALTGVVFTDQVFGRPLRFDHKTVFTLVSWLLFGTLLVGRRLRGWRGRTALAFTTAGFALLLLGYVGSRFVLEVILQRS